MVTTLLLSPSLGSDRIAEATFRLEGHAEVVSVPGGASVGDVLRRSDGYLCVGFPREFPPETDAYARLRFVQTVLAGVDHIPLERLPAHVTVCGNAGAYNTALAEHAFALLLSAAKRVVLHTTNIRNQVFDQEVPSRALRGATLGIVGLGGIGTEVGRLGRAFGMTVMGITKGGRSDFPADFVGGPGDLPRVLQAADFLVISVPMTKATRHLVSGPQLQAMKREAVLVNVSRGDVVKEEDLYRHLRDTPSFFAASDVWWRYPEGSGFPFSYPFQNLSNFLGTPHVAWNVPQQRMEALSAAVTNVLAWLAGRPLGNVIDVSEYR